MDRGEICSRFIDSLTFELYPFQEEALLAWFESDGGVLVAAPTGMGKTLIAEAAIFEALTNRQRLYYTTPLIALTDQKFREIQDKAVAWGFARDDVGLITGNRRVNPDTLVRVVVAEILLNHLLAASPVIPTAPGLHVRGIEAVPGAGERFDDVAAVVLDEFHYFNDPERGVVWELALVLLPAHVRLMLLSATVGNTIEFVSWLKSEHGRVLRRVQTDERRVPLEFIWVGDKLLTEHLPEMVSENDADSRAPALVFCFNRDECWEVAERLKGVGLIGQTARAQIETHLDERKADFVEGIGPKLRQMLIRGVGVHHAGVLPKHKEVVEALFLRKLIPFVVCTETLAAGINLPARSVVLNELLKGKRGEKKLIFASAAHQMFGRAGRPQFDKQGYVYAMAHEDDARIAKWKKKYEQIDAGSKDPGVMRMRKELERKRPTRRSTEQYWTEGQFQTLIKAGPAKLASRSMIPYSVLTFLLTRDGSLRDVRSFLSRRFNTAEQLAKFQEQLDSMIANLEGLGYLARSEDGEHVTLSDSIYGLLTFRSVDPLYGAFLSSRLAHGSFEEKLAALESILPLPPAMERLVRPPDDRPPGPLQSQVIEPALVQLGIVVAKPQVAADEEEFDDPWAEEEERPPTFPEMLKLVFQSTLKVPEEVFVQPKWVAGGAFELDSDFYKFVKSRDLTKNEGLVLRHLLRMVILAGEFRTRTEDPDYQIMAEKATLACQRVDARYTERFLAAEDEARKLVLP